MLNNISPLLIRIQNYHLKYPNVLRQMSLCEWCFTQKIDFLLTNRVILAINWRDSLGSLGI